MQFLYPIPSNSIVTQTFAEHVHAARINNWQQYNGGIDWAVPSGTPVVASQDGTVAMVRNDATGYGTHVRIQHDGGFLTIYAHLMDFSVKVGDKVRAGQVVGRSDNTGNSTGPHLHFELRRNNQAVDPQNMLVVSLSPEGRPPVPVEPGGGGVQPGPVGPGGEIPVGEEPESFPLLPIARVISPVGLNVRLGPGTGNPTVGWLPTGAQVEVMRKAPGGDSGDLWVQIGFQQYIAMKAGGDTLAVWFAPGAPLGVAMAAPKPRRSRKKKKAPAEPES